MPFCCRTAVSGAILATAAVLLCPAQAGAGPAAAPAGPGWSAAPAPGDGAEPSPQDRPYFYLEGAPGTVLKDRLSLGNPTGRAVTLRLRGSGTGSWIALAVREVRIPPRTRATVPFTVTVPHDAVPGDRPGALVATGAGRRGGRAAVPVHLRVTGPALSALTVEHMAVRGRGSAAVIRYTLVNRGNTALTPRLSVRADGVAGPVLRRAARTLPVTLRPGQSLDLTEKWADPPGLDVVDVRLTVTAEGGAHGSATASYAAVPWGAVAGAALAVAAAGGAVAVRRRARGAARPPDERCAAAEDRASGGEGADAAGELAGTGSGARS
ncbi:COG1470 family protein [Streptomyces sp. NPDC002446]